MQKLNGFAHLKVFCGSDIIGHYTGATDAPLVLGKQRLSYVEVAQRTGLPAGRTARLISTLATDHKANSIEDLYKKSSPSSLAVHGFGAGSLLMVFRLFESEGLDVKDWARRGDHWTAEGKDNFTTWHTYKLREADADKRTSRTKQIGPREKGYRKVAIREQKKADRRAGIG